MIAQRIRCHRGIRPLVTDLEDRRLLSVAVVEVTNQSSYYITASYRWSPNSSWSTFREAPGQGMLFWTNNNGTLTPQVNYATTTAAGSQTTSTLPQGYGTWSGTGTPPVSSAQVYQFQNTSTGVQLSGVPNSPPAAPKLTASATSATQASLSWNTVSDASGYAVEAMVNGSWAMLGTLSAGSTSCTVSGLTAGSTYKFRVGATNAAGTTWSTAQSVTTSQPGGSGGTGGTSGSTITEPTAGAAYSPVTGTLFASSGPSYLDVRQGNEGDCWLMASFAAVAARAPQDIQSMFTSLGTTVENGVNVAVYKVRFYDSNDVARYVTVDAQLPAGGNYYDQPSAGVLWAALAEKAYAEANAAGYVTTSSPGVNSYDALNGGDPAWALQAITGNANDYMTTTFSNLAAAWTSGKIIVIGSDATPSSSSIVGDHAYAVVGYNASSSAPFSVYNPWGPSNVTYNGHQVYGQFTASAAFLAQNYDFYSQSSAAAYSLEVPAQNPTSSSSDGTISYGADVPNASSSRQFGSASRSQNGVRATGDAALSSTSGSFFANADVFHRRAGFALSS